MHKTGYHLSDNQSRDRYSWRRWGPGMSTQNSTEAIFQHLVYSSCLSGSALRSPPWSADPVHKYPGASDRSKARPVSRF